MWEGGRKMTTARNSRILRTIPLLIAICLISFPARAKYGGGTGEPNNPYQIATAEDLMLLGESPEDYDKHFILTADIDMDPNLPGGKVFDKAVIAPDTDPAKQIFQGISFTGVFDGNWHTILHLTVNGVSYLGLFGQLDSEAEVRNLGVVDVNITGSGDYIGALVGFNSGLIATSYSTGTVSGDQRVGGLTAGNYGSITMSYSTCTVTGDLGVGGLVGDNYDSSSITTSYGMGTVSGNEGVGGLVGRNWGSITTSYYSMGTVSGNKYVGGLVGYSWTGSITASYSTSSVTGVENVGGLAGMNGSDIAMCYSTGVVIGDENVGGLVGDCQYGTITTSFWDMETSGQTSIDCGMGLTTAEMQDINTFLNAGWDCIDDVLNGTCDYWQISQGDYPQLRYHAGDSPVMPEGLGTADEPYLIRDARDLGTVWFEPLAHYRLEAFVDLSGIAWSIAVIPWFGGIFDGNGYVVSNLNIQGGGYLGLFGLLGSDAVISNLGLEEVDVNGIGYLIGGLVGFNDGGIITTSYSAGMVSGNHTIGGLVGRTTGGSITTSHSACMVSGYSFIGGLAGDNYGRVSICCCAGSVSGDRYIGGLVGRNVYKVYDCYSNGNVEGNWRVGGLVGLNYGPVTNCYSTGSVTGNEDVGGLVGYNDDDSITTSFWDVETSGVFNMCGGQNTDAKGCDDSFGKTTAEMQTASTFLDAGWDFVDEVENGTEDIWWIDEGRDYPRLTWELEQASPYGGGTGEPNNPYLIYIAEHLNAIGAEPNDWDKHFKLMADIDLSGITYERALIAPDTNDIEPGFQGTRFMGVFDGNWHTILHLTVTGESYLGLFGQLESEAEIRNLGVVDVNITGSGDYIGALVGFNSGFIATSYGTGTVTGGYGSRFLGGLTGRNWGGITRSYNMVAITGNEDVGGLAAGNYGSITTSYSTGAVTANWDVGGLVGENYGSITSSYSTGTVTGNNRVGGLVGYNWEDASIASSFWDMETSGLLTSDGGVGKTTAEMQMESTFTDAGWDFVDETENGTEDIWWIDEGLDYPRLWWELIEDDSPTSAE
jgi:hypothetical protein